MFSATVRLLMILGYAQQAVWAGGEIKGAIPGPQPTDSNPTLNECDELL